MIRPGTSSTGYTWLRDALIPGESALLEALWVYPWISLALAFAGSTAHLRFPLPWIVGLIAAPALAGRWLERSFSGRVVLRRLALVLLVACLLLLFVRTETLPGSAVTDWRWLGEALWPWAEREAADRQNLILFGWLVACLLLIRGVWLAEGEITGAAAARWFLGGLAAFLLLFAGLIHAPPAAFSADRPWLGPLLALYFVLGIGWLAVIQRQHIEEQTFRRSSDRVSLAWLALVAAIGGALLLVATLAALLGVVAVRPAEQVAVLLAGGAWQAVVTIWTGMSVAVLFVVHAILRLLGLLPHGSAPPRATPAGGGAPPPPLPGWIVKWLAPVLVVLFALLALLAVACGFILAIRLAGRLLLGGNRAPGDPVGDEERTSLWSWTLVLAQLRGLARHLTRLWRAAPRRRRIAEQAGPDRPPRPPPDSVRGLYRSMLHWCRERGRPRRPDETPGEFEPALARHVPPDLARRVTAAYIAVRYGRASLPDEERELLLEGWRQYQGEATRQPPGDTEPHQPR
ncbi:MAG: DUF4129 domain-containing protein [Chloroflexi bacterium]|nr:DUF4129 domain-containing protein [Chloroflexota bacterium]